MGETKPACGHRLSQTRKCERRPRHSSAAADSFRKMRAALLACLVGLLQVPPLPRVAGFAPTPSARWHGLRSEGLAVRGRLVRPADASVLRGSAGGDGDAKAPAALGPAGEAAEIATEITGDAQFDAAWRAAWINKDRIRCPFFKRRATDALEAALAVGRFILARHKSLLSLAPRSKGGAKATGLAPEALLEVIRRDFEEKRYYVTGRLTREVYSDACFFDAPDPDMPVDGLEKYIEAISNLFEVRSSECELLDLQVVSPHLLLSRWRLEAMLKLPWRPRIKAYTGTTLYELDADGLICRHTELWSISAADAFISTVLPHRPGAAPPAPAADALLALPAHQRSPDPYPLFRAAAAHKLKVPVWSSYFFLGGLRRWEREPLQVLSGSARGLAAGAVEPL